MTMSETIYPDVVAGPPRPSQIIQPGVFSLPPGTERYVVAGCGAALIPVEQGDIITITNDEGGQACEIVAADKTGKIDTGVLGEKSNSNADGLKALLLQNDQSLKSLKLGLEARGLDLSNAKALRLFGEASSAGDNAEFTVTRDGIVIIAALGKAMDAELQDTATPLTVMVKRAVLKSNARFELPDPLAEPLDEIRVHTQTAEAYFVKAGDFIQIIDVDGRQCTDFECFSARKLDKGIEHALDVTTTRTLMATPIQCPACMRNIMIRKWCRW